MAEINSVGLVEVSGVAAGYMVEDAMLKAASVQLLLARTICSGKFLIVVSGDVASVGASVEAGAKVAGACLIEKRHIARVHPSVFPALSMSVDLNGSNLRSLGVIETFSASCVVEVADAAAKAADITLLRIHMAMALGGKGFVLLTGDVSSVEAAVAAGSRIAAEEGMLVGKGVIAAPDKELLRDFV